MIRAVLDTSSLYSSTLRRQLQEAAAIGLYTGLWSPWIIAELNRVLVWRWIRAHAGDLSLAAERACSKAANTMMEILLPTFELVTPLPPYPAAWPMLADSYDYPIWAAAVIGQAHFVVSENSRHYPPRQQDGRCLYAGIEYLPAQTFLTTLVNQ